MQTKQEQNIPTITTDLRKDIITVPKSISQASGIRIFGKLIRSIIFTTDIAIICNNDADAVIAVYPFTPHPAIIQSITLAANIPVFSGVGGGLTHGKRSANISLFAEAQGSLGVVVNAPTPTSTIKEISDNIDIPIIGTIVSEFTDIQEKITAGISILNVSGGTQTAKMVKKIREDFPDIAIIATGGPTEASILETIEAGANAITYTPPSNGVLFSKKMEKYRDQEEAHYQE
ncbi:hydrolase [Carnobacterium divergens]|uniref:hydrolase n=1 Tax=Carnobacterium divergens TaxID=2748 RepID=UPI001071E5E0|nr:hydrolase [Carnobacterium divergens]MPQ22014.1 hydrolase [Carnobacterium divergens]TFJ47454.1 hydrolase [Carnobacterium divergens]TFJ54494.1 hydrolase [Carnobacterium divergens]